MDEKELNLAGGYEILNLSLDDFDFSQWTFESRFASAYIFWDRAGTIWQESVRLFPDITVITADPSKIVMRDGPIDFTVEAGRVAVQVYEESKLKDAPSIAGKFAKMISSKLELAEVTRIGIRTVYSKTFPTREAAAEALLKLNLLNIPDGKYLGAAGLPLNPEMSFRKEEGNNGFSIRIKAEGIEYKLELPYLWRSIAKSVKEVHEVLSFDVDVYLHGIILLSQIVFDDWIAKTMHVVRRDSGHFFGG